MHSSLLFSQLPTALGVVNNFIRLITSNGTFYINFRVVDGVYEQVGAMCGGWRL
jgi:hypothetical protein